MSGRARIHGFMSGRADLRGFTLIEVMVALLIVTTLLAGLSIPLATQVQWRRQEETRRLLDEAREAVLGFAAANGRLPCPALDSSRGEEAFEPGGDAANGRCARFHGGYLPAATLGLSPLDEDGFARDAWGLRPNRLRYSVHGLEAVNGVEQALTRANGMQAATLTGLGAAPNYLLICASGTGAGPSGCGPAANHLTRRAAFVLHSAGANAGATPAPGSDEARNLEGGPAFVWHEHSLAPGNPFDDVLTWVPVAVLASRMMAAGRLP